MSSNKPEEVNKFYKEEISENKNISFMSKLKDRIKSLLMQFATVKSDKGDLVYNTESLEVGSEVYTEDESGENVPAADGEYVLEDGRTVVVAEGKVTEIKEKEEAPAEPAAEAAPAEEQMADPAPETPAEPAPAENEKVTALEERVAALESQLADVIAKLAEIQTTPAAAPIEDEFNVTPKTDPKNKMAAIAAAYRAAKERK